MPRVSLTAGLALAFALVFAFDMAAASTAAAQSASEVIGSPETGQGIAGYLTSMPLSGREVVLLYLLGGVIVLAMASFLLAERMSLRSHLCMSLLIVIIAAFGLLLLLGTSGAFKGALGALFFFAMIFVLRSMSQFESFRKGR